MDTKNNPQSTSPLSEETMKKLMDAIINAEEENYRCPECGWEEGILSPRFTEIHFTDKGLLCPQCLQNFLLTKVPVMLELGK